MPEIKVRFRRGNLGDDYYWDPDPSHHYSIRRETWASANIFEITYPDGHRESTSTLRDARRWVGKHYEKSLS